VWRAWRTSEAVLIVQAGWRARGRGSLLVHPPPHLSRADHTLTRRHGPVQPPAAIHSGHGSTPGPALANQAAQGVPAPPTAARRDPLDLEPARVRSPAELGTTTPTAATVGACPRPRRPHRPRRLAPHLRSSPPRLARQTALVHLDHLAAPLRPGLGRLLAHRHRLDHRPPRRRPPHRLGERLCRRPPRAARVRHARTGPRRPVRRLWQRTRRRTRGRPRPEPRSASCSSPPLSLSVPSSSPTDSSSPRPADRHLAERASRPNYPSHST